MRKLCQLCNISDVCIIIQYVRAYYVGGDFVFRWRDILYLNRAKAAKKHGRNCLWVFNYPLSGGLFQVLY